MEAAQQVNKHLESKGIPHLLIDEIGSNCEIFHIDFNWFIVDFLICDLIDSQKRLKSFWDKIEGVVICIDEHLAGTQIKNTQHILHFSVPIQDFRLFLNRFSAMLEFNGDVSMGKEHYMYTLLQLLEIGFIEIFHRNRLGMLRSLHQLFSLIIIISSSCQNLCNCYNETDRKYQKNWWNWVRYFNELYRSE